jgi:hypothetical protein
MRDNNFVWWAFRITEMITCIHIILGFWFFHFSKITLYFNS